MDENVKPKVKKKWNRTELASKAKAAGPISHLGKFNDFYRRDFIRAHHAEIRGNGMGGNGDGEGATKQFNVYLQIVYKYTHTRHRRQAFFALFLHRSPSFYPYITPFHLRRFGCLILNGEMIYYICTFIATTRSFFSCSSPPPLPLLLSRYLALSLSLSPSPSRSLTLSLSRSLALSSPLSFAHSPSLIRSLVLPPVLNSTTFATFI